MVTSRLLVILLLVAGSFAHAQKARPKKPSVVARVVALDIIGNDTVVTVAAGSELGVAKTARARFREGTTTKLLAGGDAVVIRIDRRTSVLKTKLTPAQVRENKLVQLDP